MIFAVCLLSLKTFSLFSCFSGELKAILADEGYLTDIRTAITGRIAAYYLAPRYFLVTN